MTNFCGICKKDMSNITVSVQANLINNEKTWREYWEKKDHKFYFPEKDLTTCVDCFKILSSWEIYPNKARYVMNRQIFGKKPKLKFPIPVVYDKCVYCDKETEYSINDSIYSREHYISGLGQYCLDCYNKVTQDRTVITEFYENYLL